MICDMVVLMMFRVGVKDNVVFVCVVVIFNFCFLLDSDLLFILCVIEGVIDDFCV